MPIFEFRCKECEHKFEELVSTSEAKVVCPKCSSDSTEKLLSTFSSAGGRQSGASSSGGQSSCGSGFS
ncbi:MAG: zinc ribbon domain-containing protein [candidate division Zixibacteria bacterium]|nr:zinc ribbon domain-containing protein [candidate division Zixibacteria bacterium]